VIVGKQSFFCLENAGHLARKTQKKHFKVLATKPSIQKEGLIASQEESA
jgi:hypothetical protein